MKKLLIFCNYYFSANRRCFTTCFNTFKCCSNCPKYCRVVQKLFWAFLHKSFWGVLHKHSKIKFDILTILGSSNQFKQQNSRHSLVLLNIEPFNFHKNNKHHIFRSIKNLRLLLFYICCLLHFVKKNIESTVFPSIKKYKTRFP